MARRIIANPNVYNNSNEDEQEVNMPPIDEVPSHDLLSEAVTSQIQTSTVESSLIQRKNNVDPPSFGLPLGFVPPPRITFFFAPTRTSDCVNPIISRSVSVKGNIAGTNNSGFMGNFPYGYTDNSSISRITNTTL
ncbi:hypothetical protein QL285_096882 [Trifolium repens]|jgi:hypothetical protein|nr:hypothetical protein QL285_096882 [Trifolium repens]